jgi:ketosteroid isomerase-like protein
MSTQSNLDVVKGIYEAFGRGDVPAILERLAPDVAWDVGSGDHGIPWLTPRTGREAVAAFVATLQALDFHDFRIVQLFAEGPWVIAMLAVEAEVKATGKRFRDDAEIHVWRFDDRGRVVTFRHQVDTHQHLLALSP